jgi:hypothetical protein
MCNEQTLRRVRLSESAQFRRDHAAMLAEKLDTTEAKIQQSVLSRFEMIRRDFYRQIASADNLRRRKMELDEEIHKQQKEVCVFSSSLGRQWAHFFAREKCKFRPPLEL